MATKDKVLFIVGGAGGIGSAIAREALKCGGKGVSIIDLCENTGKKTVEFLEKEFGTNSAIFIKADITEKKQFEEAFEITIQRYKQLDIVINSAGIVDEIEWEKTVAVDLKAAMIGTYMALEKYLPKYKSSDEGIIVNIASVLGFQKVQSYPSYCVSKAGLISLGRCLGGEEYYKRFKVKVITICPGAVQTNMLSENSNKSYLPKEVAGKELDGLNQLEMPEELAEALIKIISEGSNGSVWVKEDHLPAYEVDIPNYKSFRKKPQL